MSKDDSRPLTRDLAPFGVRMPPDLKERVESAAKANNRSMNAEIVATLEKEYPAPITGISNYDAIYNLMSYIYSSMDHIRAASTELEQDLIIVEANRKLEASGSPIVLRFSSEPDSQGLRKVHMTKAKCG